VDNARGRSLKIIAGDFNAWAVEWGSSVSNPRGRAVIDAMGMLDLILLNDELCNNPIRIFCVDLPAT